MGLKIIINPNIESRIDDILDPYVDAAYEDDIFWPNCWRETVDNLRDIFDERQCPFTINIIDGINYLANSTGCPNCDDNAFCWFYRFAVAWLNRDELPTFVGCNCLK